LQLLGGVGSSVGPSVVVHFVGEVGIVELSVVVHFVGEVGIVGLSVVVFRSDGTTKKKDVLRLAQNV